MYDLFIQPKYENYREYRDFADEHGLSLEILDFALNPVLNDAGQWKYLTDFYRLALSTFQGDVTMHGPFMDILVHSPNRTVAEASRNQVRRALDVAGTIGANAVVFHTGFNPVLRNPRYAPAWLESSRIFWEKITREYDTEILLENMWDPTPDRLSDLLCTLPDLVNHCFDVGHHHVFGAGSMEDWIAKLSSRLTYIHLNDNHGESDEEIAAGSGTVDWARFNRCIATLSQNPRVVLEVKGLAEIRRSIDYLRTNEIYPF